MKEHGGIVILPLVPERHEPCDVLAIGLGKSEPDLSATVLAADLSELVAAYVLAESLDTAAGQLHRLPLPGRSRPSVLLLVGLGNETPADVRIAAVALGRAIAGLPESRSVAVALDAPDAAHSRALAEGLVLGGYDFDLSSEPSDELRVVHLVGSVHHDGLATGDAAADAAGWARDLGNTPADRLTPHGLAVAARDQLTAAGCQVSVREPDWLAANGFGGVLAVGGGSASGPRFIQASWTPPKPRGKPHIVLVGKGITFDSGGLNLKPPDGMRMMYTDMCGGAAVLAALHFAAVRRLDLRVTVLVPAAENAVSGSAMRPSDVITHVGGRTTEIGNTDAEGRLVLADALAWAVSTLKPDAVIDVATLTGAMKVALGTETAGYFANDDALATLLEQAAEATGEAIWRMPLEHHHLGLLDSPIADARNDPGTPGAITAALFLQPFVGSVAWAHLDIAGPARAATDGPIFSRGATGFGTRLLASYLESVANGSASSR